MTEDHRTVIIGKLKDAHVMASFNLYLIME